MDATVRMDVADPRSLAVGQLSEPPAKDVMLRQAGKFRIGCRQRLEQRVVDHRLAGLLCPFLRFPATCLEQGRDLDARIEVLYRRELCKQLRFERGTPCFPALA